MFSQIYNKLPRKLRSNISRLNYDISGRPRVNHSTNLNKSFPDNYKGGLIISADLEMGWAVRYSKENKDPEEYGKRERENIPVILEQLDRYKIPVTWSAVGHLFLRECKKGDHDWMQRIPYFDKHWKFTEGDWFDHDPYTNFSIDPAWYAPDILKMIIKCETKQEIAFHTFSHIDCSYENCPEAVIDDEFKAGMKIAEKWNIIFKSMTFPGGRAGNYETLKKYGIKICRERYNNYELSYPFINKHNIIIAPTGPAITIKYKEWPIQYTLSQYKKGIQRAIDTRTFIHLWFHPSQKREDFKDLAPLIFEYAAERRDEGDLWITTMGELADYISANCLI